MRISKSVIGLFQKCQYKWYRDRHYKPMQQPEQENDIGSQGKLLHDLIRRVLLSQPLPQMNDENKQIMSVFLEKVSEIKSINKEYLHTEHHISVNTRDKPIKWDSEKGLFSVIDAWSYDFHNQVLHIYDWKTGYKSYDPNDDDVAIQFVLAAYLLYSESVFSNKIKEEIKKAKVVLFHIINPRLREDLERSMTWNEIRDFKLHRIDPVIKMMRAVHKKLKKQVEKSELKALDSLDTDTNCNPDYCAYSHCCPRWTRVNAEFKEIAVALKPLDNLPEIRQGNAYLWIIAMRSFDAIHKSLKKTVRDFLKTGVTIAFFENGDPVLASYKEVEGGISYTKNKGDLLAEIMQVEDTIVLAGILQDIIKTDGKSVEKAIEHLPDLSDKIKELGIVSKRRVVVVEPYKGDATELDMKKY